MLALAATLGFCCLAAHEGPVFCLLSTDSHLVSAGNGEISSWSWSELIKKVSVAMTTAPSENCFTHSGFFFAARQTSVDKKTKLQVRHLPWLQPSVDVTLSGSCFRSSLEIPEINSMVLNARVSVMCLTNLSWLPASCDPCSLWDRTTV